MGASDCFKWGFSIDQKRARGGEAYARGKTLVVFLDAAAGAWFPNRVAKALPDPLYFDEVWVVGLYGIENGEYTRARDHLLVTGVPPVSEFLDDLRTDDGSSLR